MKINNIEIHTALAARLTEFRKAMKIAEKMAAKVAKGPTLYQLLFPAN